jgi:hypothetical protein
MPTHASPYHHVVPFLKAALPSFAASPDYRLVVGNDDLPGVILAAYGRFLSRLASAGAAAELARGVAAIEALYGWDDMMVRTAIRDEFIESLDGDDDAIAVIRPLLSKALAAEFVDVLS